MRKIVMELGYPLWALAYYVRETSGMSMAEEMQTQPKESVTFWLMTGKN